jgi:putative aldouronate transport system permease protein
MTSSMAKISGTANRRISSVVSVKAWKSTLRKIYRNYQLYLFLLPTILYFLIFKYAPMYGIQIAFKNFIAPKGIWGSAWVGFQHFERFFSSYQFGTLLWNTISLNIYSLLIAFPLPIILALLMNQFPSQRYRRLVQTVIYAPTFISTVVLVGMIYIFLSPRTGIVNNLLVLLGAEPIHFMARADWFPSIYVFSGAWQGTGFATIVYMAALIGIDPSLHEAAIMDGANKWQRIRHIDLPSIMPTIVILFILAVGNIMNVGFEKVLLMQTPLNLGTSQVIQTYVYDVGLVRAQYSFAAAVGLFNAVINLILLLSFNWIARRTTKTSLW